VRQLTVRGFDEELARHLRKVARQKGVSLNKAALLLLRKGAGISEEPGDASVVGDTLDHLIGAWSKREEREFLKAIETFEQIDASLWK
jgi:antitoxin FitA-like protein